MKIYQYLYASLLITALLSSCKKNNPAPNTGGTDTTKQVIPAFDINSINDTYADIAPFTYYPKWTVYNVHDPSIKKFGDYYYC
jgi:arabinan endo-1,5-alpha-L-arabinosidase